jgi:hypothetical protein
MKIPATIELTIPDPPKPEPITRPVVCVCPNDGRLVYHAWNDLWLEADTHDPHTCDVDQEFRKKVGQRP